MEGSVKEYVLSLPVPPPANKRLAVVRGRMVKTAAHREYMHLVQWACTRQNVTPIKGEVAVNIKWFRARKAGDIDGILKILLDSFTGFAYDDDSQISNLHITRFDTDKTNPRVVVSIEEIG